MAKVILVREILEIAFENNFCFMRKVATFEEHISDIESGNQLLPKMLSNGNGAISHLQTETGFVEDFCYSLYN